MLDTKREPMGHLHEHNGHASHGDIAAGGLSVSLRLAATIALNLLITVVQVVGGFLSGSLALISDAVHNFSDAIAVLVSYIAYRLSEREYTEEKTFGYKRAEVLAALLNAGVLIVVTVFLFREAIVRLGAPHRIDGALMFWVAVLGLVGNVVGVALLARDSRGNLNVRAAFLHLVADSVSSVAVIAGALAIIFWRNALVDPVITILIGVYVLKESFDLLMETTNILMQATPRHLDVRKIQEELESIEGIESLHHVHLWQLNDREIHFEGHLDVCEDLPLSKASELRERAEAMLKEAFGISHVTLQLEYRACADRSLVKKRTGDSDTSKAARD